MLANFSPEMIANLAIRLLESWFLSVGLCPVEDFDPCDPNCVRYTGPHVVYTAHAVMPPRWGANVLVLRASFQNYIDSHNRATPFPEARFAVYNLCFYPDSDGGGSSYASISQ